MNDMNGLWNHPQLKARNRWKLVDTPVGEVPALLPPGVNDSFEYRMDPIPTIGEHSETILKEIGFTDDVIANMKETKAI